MFPDAPDPETGGRQLEQLAFEVVSSESLSHAGREAAKLIARGVRRVFAIDVERARALEWSSSLGTWSVLDPGAHLEDRALEVPLPIGALLLAAKADDAVARALVAKHNPVIEEVRSRGISEGIARGRAEGKQEGLAEGVARGRAESLLEMLAARGISLDSGERARILGERDPAILARWTVRAVTCTDLSEVFEEA